MAFLLVGLIIGGPVLNIQKNVGKMEKAYKCITEIAKNASGDLSNSATKPVGGKILYAYQSIVGVFLHK